jgi:hypothetical protein
MNVDISELEEKNLDELALLERPMWLPQTKKRAHPWVRPYK